VDEAERRRVETEFVERMQAELSRVPVRDHLTAFMTSLSSMAFLHLGLSSDTERDRDLEQSRLAIDSFKALTDVLAPLVAAESAGLYRSTLAQMQMAYVAALDKGSKPEEAVEAAPAEPPTGDPAT
jgi:hypothetical protein